MTKYKIWLHIEKITGEEGYEEYEDAAPFPWSLGEYDNYEEAEDLAQRLEDSIPTVAAAKRARKSGKEKVIR
jgi:hypothetical protein